MTEKTLRTDGGGRGRPDWRGNKPIAGIVARVTGPILKKRGFAEARIVTEWPQIVGPELAATCMPEKLVMGRGGADGRAAPGTLHIRAPGAVATELQHMAPIIIERVNGYFGYPAVARLRLIQAPFVAARPRRIRREPSEQAARTVDAAVETVADPELRDILRALGRAIHARDERSRRRESKR